MISGWLSRLTTVVKRTDAVYECRHCGTTVDDGADTCPECGSDEIARYRLS